MRQGYSLLVCACQQLYSTIHYMDSTYGTCRLYQNPPPSSITLAIYFLQETGSEASHYSEKTVHMM